MREIKFRAWNGEYLEYIDDLYWFEERSVHYNGDGFGVRWELMQYTGLLDKRGKEIYEGDILKDSYIIKDEQVIDIGYIEIINGCACLTYNDGELEYYPVYGGLTDYEVIGNIYENPELLRN